MLEGYLTERLIIAELKALDKEDAIKEISAKISEIIGLNKEKIYSELKKREDLDSTGIENGFAVPHAKIEGLEKMTLALARSTKGINFASLDRKLTHLFFVLLAPGKESSEHMKLLARLAKIMCVKGLREKLLSAKDSKKICDILIEADKSAD